MLQNSIPAEILELWLVTGTQNTFGSYNIHTVRAHVCQSVLQYSHHSILLKG